MLEIVRAAGRFGDGIKMVCLGAIDHSNPYHAAVLAQAGANVVFPGAIFDPEVTAALRKHCLAYVHGHTVGGTNPSLVEAMGAGCAIIADDNIYNRWTAGGDQLYFSTEVGCLTSMRRAIDDPQLIERARASAAARFAPSSSGTASWPPTRTYSPFAPRRRPTELIRRCAWRARPSCRRPPPPS